VAYRLSGEYAEADRRLNQALEMFSNMKTRWQIGRTLFELGQLEAVRTNTPKAHDYFTHALTAFEEMCAYPDAARTRAAIEELNHA
jgi:tetratricopeptide (TPR) repeat protein